MVGRAFAGTGLPKKSLPPFGKQKPANRRSTLVDGDSIVGQDGCLPFPEVDDVVVDLSPNPAQIP